MLIVRTVALVSYLLVGFELIVLPVPSEASLAERARRLGARRLGRLAPHAAAVATSCLGFLAPAAWIVAPQAANVLLPLYRPGVFIGAVVPIIAGALISLVAVVQVRRARRRQEAAFGGLFAFSRNPALVGLYVQWVGLCLAVPSPFVILGLVVCGVHMDRRVRVEEGKLQHRFGAEYSRYASKVCRYVGRRRQPASRCSSGSIGD